MPGTTSESPASEPLRPDELAVARAVVAGALWPPGATLLAAISGGADSLCLLGMLLMLRAAGGPAAPGEIIVATLDHGLRGAAGVDDARWVTELAARLGLRCYSERVETGAYATSQRLSLEDAARRLRYAFLRRVAREVGAARICLGHTLDDQAETIILRLLRGAGLDGLAGMRPLRGDLARPLLGLTHAQAVMWCAARGWLPREDLTNRDERFLRNRVRRRLLPLLEAYNPNMKQTLARNAAFIADDLAALESATDDAWAEVVVSQTRSSVVMDLSSLRDQSPALRRRLLRRAAQRLCALRPRYATEPEAENAATGGLEARHIALIERFIAEGRSGGALTLPDGLRAHLDYAALRLTCDLPGATADDEPRQQLDQQRAEWALPIPGAMESAALGWRVLAAPLTTAPGLEGDALPPVPRIAPVIHAGDLADGQRGELRVYVDADRVAGALTVRAWRPGDRFRPLGMAHEKKLQDVFSDAKVPRATRRRLPIVLAGDRIVWVVGVRIADEFKLTQATRRVLALQAEPLDAARVSENETAAANAVDSVNTSDVTDGMEESER